jgi:hypothetical protein
MIFGTIPPVSLCAYEFNEICSIIYGNVFESFIGKVHYCEQNILLAFPSSATETSPFNKGATPTKSDLLLFTLQFVSTPSLYATLT